MAHIIDENPLAFIVGTITILLTLICLNISIDNYIEKQMQIECIKNGGTINISKHYGYSPIIYCSK